jgi:hypothetical protein
MPLFFMRKIFLMKSIPIGEVHSILWDNQVMQHYRNGGGTFKVVRKTP